MYFSAYIFCSLSPVSSGCLSASCYVVSIFSLHFHTALARNWAYRSIFWASSLSLLISFYTASTALRARTYCSQIHLSLTLRLFSLESSSVLELACLRFLRRNPGPQAVIFSFSVFLPWAFRAWWAVTARASSVCPGRHFQS